MYMHPYPSKDNTQVSLHLPQLLTQVCYSLLNPIHVTYLSVQTYSWCIETIDSYIDRLYCLALLRGSATLNFRQHDLESIGILA